MSALPTSSTTSLTSATSLPTPTLVRALLVVLGADGRPEASTHRLDASKATRLTVGRSMACDVVVDDPHVAAEHAEVCIDEKGALRIRDLGSLNGTRLDDVAAPEHVVTDEGEHTVVVGHTRLSLRGQAAVLAPEQPVGADSERRRRARRDLEGHEPSRLFQALGRPRWLAVMSLAVLAALVSLQWLEMSWQRPSWAKVVTGVLGLLMISGVWLGFWALVGRVVAGRPRWGMQAGVMLATALVLALGREAIHLAVFATGRVLPSIVGTIGGIACMALLLAAHLRVATHLRLRHVIACAVVLPAMSLGMNLWQSYGAAGSREWRHTEGAVFYPPAWRVVRLPDTATLLTDARALEPRALQRMEASKDAEETSDDDDSSD